uniref:tripartite tricarboxylate transporter TctB family protein n=1 Tax=Neorhizobium sp. EC2-8 TaxID=3129230 RepID=UPI003100ADF3
MIGIRNGRDFLGGLSMIAAGSLFLWFGRDLAAGNSFQMGPGYFPRLLSSLLILIGLVMAMKAVVVEGDQDADAPFNPKAFLLVIGGPLFFAFALTRLGLAPTVFLVTVGVSFASIYVRSARALALGAGLALFASILFTRLLALPLDAFGPWLSF